MPKSIIIQSGATGMSAEAGQRGPASPVLVELFPSQHPLRLQKHQCPVAIRTVDLCGGPDSAIRITLRNVNTIHPQTGVPRALNTSWQWSPGHPDPVESVYILGICRCLKLRLRNRTFVLQDPGSLLACGALCSCLFFSCSSCVLLLFPRA
jgi:hypothetical protein